MATVFRFPLYKCSHCGYQADRPFLPGDPPGCRGCRLGRPVGACEVPDCPDCAKALPLQPSAGRVTRSVADEQECEANAEAQFYAPIQTEWDKEIHREIAHQENMGSTRLNDGERQRRIEALRKERQQILAARMAAYLQTHQPALAALKQSYLARRLASLTWLREQVAAGLREAL